MDSRMQERTSWLSSELFSSCETLIRKQVGLRFLHVGGKAESIRNFMSKYIENEPDGKGLLISGKTGTGKTTEMSYVLEQLMTVVPMEHAARAVRNEELDIYLYDTKTHGLLNTYSSVAWVTLSQLLLEIKSTFDNKNQSESEVINKYKTKKHLFIDDLGTEKVTEWTMNVLYDLIDYRYRNLLPVFITTNLTLQEISQNYGDRIASRLVEMCEIIKLDGEDWRVKNAKGRE